jgi:excisionase family DNA binding protein
MAEACDYLKVSRGTMTKRLSDGEINFATKRGKSWLFPEEKLKAYASGMA